MKTRLLFVALAMLCLSFSLFRQSILKLYPIKLGPLKAGDTVSVTVHEPHPFTGRIDVKVNVVIGADGRVTLPLLNNVAADGLTVPEFLQMLEGRYTEYFSQWIWPCCQIPRPQVTVQFVK